MLNKLKHSIVTRVSLFVTGMTVLGVVVCSLVLTFISWQEFRNITLRDYKIILKSSGSEISTYLTEARNALESLGAIMAYTRPAPDAWKKEVALTAFSHQNPRFSEVFLVDVRTRRVLTTDSGTAGPAASDSPLHLEPFMEKALSGGTTFSKVYHNDYGMPFVSIAVPVKRLGAVDELLCGELSLKLLWEVLKGVRIGATGYISVLDDKGQYIGHREIVPVLHRLSVDRLEKLEDIAFTDTVADWIDLKAGNLCMAFHIPDIGWYILFNQPLHEPYESLRRSLLRIIALTLVICLAGILLSRWWSKRLLRPLEDLHRQAKIIGQGNFDRRIERVSMDEIGELAKEFNDMTASLQMVLAERVKLERDLAHAENLAVLGKAAGKLNHEVGNLLNNMGLFIRLLKQKPMDVKERHLVQILEKDLGRARSFVKTCLQLAKRPEIRKILLPLGTVVEEALTAHRVTAKERGIEIATYWAENLPKAFLDHNMVYQVIQNLVKNSLDALGNGNGQGRIVLSGDVENGALRLSVADNGPGIPADRMEKIFEPFFTTKGEEGTGFGLVIVREIMVAHGGRIECVSPSGGGAEFRLYFPMG